MKKGLSILLLHLFFLACPGQDSLQKSWELKGYIKDLNSFVFTSDFKNVSYTNLIHNRINFKWKPSNNITAALEVRNRLYWGNDVKEIPDFESQLRNVNDAVDLSATWKISSNTLFVSNVERLWVEYRRTKWNIKAGRQRVNWGIANTWNPNDIFNAYNFLDFDYEERPGCDALKIQYAISDFSNVEISSALTGEGHQTISAIRYLTNYKGFDLQFISGVFHNNFTAGLGWAGSISNVGYKGEGQFFLGNDGFQRLGGERLDIGCVRDFRVCHDRGGIRVDQHDTVTLCFQCRDRLGTGIIKLRGLADDDGSRSRDDDGVYICAFHNK